MSRVRTIRIPKTVLATAQTLDDLDDWTTAQRPADIQQLRRIRRQEDLAGKGKNLKELLKRWPIK